MSATDKKPLPGITINTNMPDYRKDPYFVKKAERARTLLTKYGLLKEDKLKKGK